MSTQRREGRCKRWSLESRTGMQERSCFAPIMRDRDTRTNGRTARPEIQAQLHCGGTMFSLAMDELATNSLQKDYSILQLVRHTLRRDSSPLWTEPSVSFGPPALHGSSPLLISILSGSAHTRPALPQAPAGKSRWAERYDGKRDLHFQHAA
jgi:hypothetical protein